MTPRRAPSRRATASHEKSTKQGTKSNTPHQHCRHRLGWVHRVYVLKIIAYWPLNSGLLFASPICRTSWSFFRLTTKIFKFTRAYKAPLDNVFRFELWGSLEGLGGQAIEGNAPVEDYGISMGARGGFLPVLHNRDERGTL